MTSRHRPSRKPLVAIRALSNRRPSLGKAQDRRRGAFPGGAIKARHLDRPAFNRNRLKTKKSIDPNLSEQLIRLPMDAGCSLACPLLMESKAGLRVLVVSCALSENRFALFRTLSSGKGTSPCLAMPNCR